MSYLPELRGALVQAAQRHTASERPIGERPVSGQASARERVRAWLRSSRWHRVAVNVAVGLAGTLIGLNAAGVFHRGTTLGPQVTPSPTSDEGVAIARTVRLLALRVADPGGGLPWGVRVVRTTRGLTCVDAGRVDYGTIGVLGQDGAFKDDGRFHPISANVFSGLGCDVTDARGEGFVNVALQDAPASGLAGFESNQVGGCRTAEEQQRVPHLPHRLTAHIHSPALPTCPQSDMREIYFGLLGPDASSITYRTAGGQKRTIPTVGRQGAYLLVLPQKTKGCLAPAPLSSRGDSRCRYGFRGDRGGPEMPAGVISAVHYRDGRTCRVPAPGTYAALMGHACPPVGFVSPPRPHYTTRQLATPITVRPIPARSYCTKGEALEPCDRGVPAGFRRLTGGQPELLVQVSFVSRVAIPNSASYYETEMTLPRSRGCTSGGLGGPTNSDIRAGQHVVQRMFLPYSCPGVVHGTLSYVPTEGPASSMPVVGLPGHEKSILVGRFSFTVAPRRG
ncbi:MAG TPA: hypothetical protein VK272_04250 [Solirubrobacteraceae bacterium]|nr:hypothetical protein [Solirubrobacteraceae bacterium]